MSIGRAVCAALAVVVFSSACSDDGGDGDGDAGDGGGETLEPGRQVMGCFDCTEVEYCILLGAGGTESYRCAEADCGVGCTCIIEDGEKRHAECANHSCQEGSALLYCSG